MQPDRSVIFERTVDVMSTTVLAVALYFLLSGHDRPGGGFIGGLVVGAALVLRRLTGRPDPSLLARVDPIVLMGLGVAIAAGTALAGLIGGGALLESHTWTLDLPVFDTVKVASVLIFDIGVFVGVVGLVAAELDALGSAGEP